MASDLRIAGIKLPTVVVGPCPSTITVDVVNAGNDAAGFPVPMTVCLDIRSSLERPADGHYSVTLPIESPPIIPGAIRTVTFTGVQFPCAPSAFVTATADCAATVPNNARTLPELTVQVPKIVPIAWLWTDVRVGLRDSTGQVTWSPGALCPGATCVVEVSIRNAGCAAAGPSVTKLTLLDGGGQQIATMKQNTTSIAAGATSAMQFVTTLPVTATGKRITFRACSDDTGAITPQCDLLHACAEVTLPLAGTTGGPKLTFTAAKAIFPGEAAPLSWRIQNFCSDIGQATARISFQGSALYTSVAHPVGLQDVEKGEDIDVAPPAAIAPNFYKIGLSKLTLEITGTGTDPGPYTATTFVTISPEPVAGTWAFTAPPAGMSAAFQWKAPYTVEGRLTNPARAMMTPSSVVLNESPSIGAPIARNAAPPLGSIVPAAFAAGVWPLMQAWPWLAPGVWIPIGPLTAGFTYTVTFAMQDAFGNAYPATTSPSAFVAITVAASKIAFAIVAALVLAVAITLVILGFLAIATIVTIATAPVLFAAAGVAFTISSGFGIAALDPPVPNFDYRNAPKVTLPEIPAEWMAFPALAPVLSIFALLWRISNLTAAMSATEARLIAARIDRDSSATRLQLNEYRELRDSLLAASRQIPLAVLEATERMQSDPALEAMTNAKVLQRQAAAWSRGRLPEKLRRAWSDAGLPPDPLGVMEQALRAPGFSIRPLDQLLGEINQAVAQIAAGVRDESEAVLHPPGTETGV